ncbi:hypothetical protein QYF61_022050 [Mycteria americana]|uniref:Homeobox domain-containing protein n=1 Tax=Mycteria americana TaxID=33587 RepID=A0AAN7NJK3_MYCAM|nr:hypothetical protein QYF61_022050 [Mycteria americana]
MAAPRGEGSPGREPGGCRGPWGALQGPPQALLPCPCPCPMLAGYSLLPPLSLLAPSVSAAQQLPAGRDVPCTALASPCPPPPPRPLLHPGTLGHAVPGTGEDEDRQDPALLLPVREGLSPHVPQPLSSGRGCPPPRPALTPLCPLQVSPAYEVPPGLLPSTGLCPPCCWQPLPVEPGRAKAVAARESTGALKAWLARHHRNPYPSKGEKVMLAVVSRMSLTQVSTWFANARRRLKKENKAGWAPHGTSDGEDSEGEGASPGAPPGPDPSPVQDGCGGSPEGGPGPGQGKQPQKPKIWSVAAMLASPPCESGCPQGVPAVLEQG